MNRILSGRRRSVSVAVFFSCAVALPAGGVLAQSVAPAAEAPPRPTGAVHRTDLLELHGTTWVRREVQVNSHPASGQHSVAVALSDDGTAAVAWQSRRQRAGFDGAYVQRLDPAGRRVGAETPVHRAPQVQQVDPSVAVDPDGVTTWVAWEASDPRRGPLSLAAPVASARGVASEPIELGAGQAPAVAARPGGGVVAVWVREDPDGVERIWCRTLDAAGNAPGDARCLAVGPRTERAGVPSIVRLANDRGFAVAWAATGLDRTPCGLRIQRLDRRGAPRGGPRCVGGKRASGSIEPSIAARPDGGLVVAWMDNGGTDRPYRVLARLFDAEVRAGATIAVSGAAEGVPLSGAHVAAAQDGSGRFCVAWNAAESEVGRVHDVMARLFDADGTALTDAFVASVHRGGDQRLEIASNRPAVAFGADGRLFFAWTGDGDLGDPSGAHGTVWLPAGSPLATALGDATPDVAALAEPAPRREPDPLVRVAHDDTLALAQLARPHDPPTFTGTLPQRRGATGGGQDVAMANGFEAITNTGWTPPDPVAAAGPKHVVVVVNGGIAFFRKDNGNREFFQALTGNQGFWAGVGAQTFVFDPRVAFDPHSGRFVAMAAEHAGGASFIVIAVSDDWNPNGTWFKYRFATPNVPGSIDFPHLGVDERAIYVGANYFGPFTNRLFIFDKQLLMTGQAHPAPPVLTTGSGSTAWGTQFGSSLTAYGIAANTGSSVRLFAVRSPLGSPNLRTATVSVPSYSQPADAPQQGTTNRLNTVDSRFAPIFYRNGRLWAVHNVNAPVRARWYEFDVSSWPAGTAPRLVQWGEIVPTPGVSTFLPSIATDPYGNTLVCYARSSTSETPSVAFAYRRASDPFGQMTTLGITHQSPQSYTRSSRWGDYSHATPDPDDVWNLWYVHEFARDTNNWSTWVGVQRVQGPNLTADTTTLSAAAGGAVNFTLDNPTHGNQRYYLLASLSGRLPRLGLPSPPGYVFLDLAADALTSSMLTFLNTPVFDRFLGNLDAQGRATATFRLPPVPPLAGQSIEFAYAQDGVVWDFGSETVTVTLQ